MHGTLHITSLDKSLTLRRCDTGMPLSLHITRVNVCVWVDWGKLCVCVCVCVCVCACVCVCVCVCVVCVGVCVCLQMSGCLSACRPPYWMCERTFMRERQNGKIKKDNACPCVSVCVCVCACVCVCVYYYFFFYFFYNYF